MKKIFFSTMIVSLLAFVGCQNEELVSESTDNSNGKKITITADIAGSTDSRVALTPDQDESGNSIIKVDWRTTGEKENFTVYNANYTQSAVFSQESGKNFVGTPFVGANRAYYGRYTVNVNNRTLSYDLSEQDGTLNEDYILMEAPYAENSTSITFDHKTAILKVAFKTSVGTFDNTTITQIVMDNVNAGSNNNSITIRRAQGEGLNNFYIFLPIESNYNAGRTFNFSVIAGVQDYKGSLTIPTGMSIEAGKFYTAKIALQEATYCELPGGTSFPSALFSKIGNNNSLRSIKFVAKSTQWNSGVLSSFTNTVLNGIVKYRINGTTLELHTNKDLFKFNCNCFRMFSPTNCSFLANITSIDFNGCINTSNVTDMQYMFDGCTNLQSLDLSSFNTSNVTVMTKMFQSCTALTSLDLSSFNTVNVTNMDYMFYSCKQLQSLDLSNFNTASVTNMKYMFCYCANLRTLTFGETFHTYSVTNFDDMFYRSSLNPGEELVVDMTKFSYEQNPNVTGIFDSMGNLIKVKVTENFFNFLSGKLAQNKLTRFLKPDGTPWVSPN